MSGLTVIVLAAGHGKRMKSKLPKVLHPVAGRSMVGHVLAAVAELQPDRVVAVVGHGRERVTEHIAARDDSVVFAVQEQQLGTGHAARVGLDAAGTTGGDVLVLTADTPLLRGETLRAFVDRHRDGKRCVSILTAEVAEPTGYGRIVREAGVVRGIVEEKDASAEQRRIREINSGIIAFDAAYLREALPRLGNDNASGEYYLTDVVKLAVADGQPTDGFPVADASETEGANDRVQLAALGRRLNRRIVEGWMREGVSVMDPETTWIEHDVKLAADVTLLSGTQLLGTTVVGEDAVIGPDTTLEDCEVGAGARVVRTHGQLAVIGQKANVGPFSYLRPGTELGSGGKIGAFVETKNAQIGEGAKVPHLSYVGDAEIGEGTNIGAGTIFANYDGVNKHRTSVGRHARTASNNTFVAPVNIGDGAGTGAGTVVREDVPPGALAVSSPRQRNIADWAQSRRAGTPQAKAAEAACQNDATGQAGQTAVTVDDAAEE